MRIYRIGNNKKIESVKDNDELRRLGIDGMYTMLKSQQRQIETLWKLVKMLNEKIENIKIGEE